MKIKEIFLSCKTEEEFINRRTNTAKDKVIRGLCGLVGIYVFIKKNAEVITK